jgi:cytochrome c
MKRTALPLLALALCALPVAGIASEDLAKSKNCLACHTVDNKILGPAFKEVAAKYQGDDAAVDALTEKVIKGGSGTWGAVPMPPNPVLSEEDAKTLVVWVLSLQ